MAVAAQKRPITEKDLFAFRWIGDTQISPDGSAVAFVEATVKANREGYETAIYVLDLTMPGAAPRMLTTGPRDTAPRWSPDGTKIVFLRSGEKEGKPGPAQLYLQGVKPAFNAVRISDLPEGAGSPQWSPKGDAIAVLSETAKDQKQAKLEAEKKAHATGDDAHVSDVRVINRAHYQANGGGFLDASEAEQIYLVELPKADGTQEAARQITGGRFGVEEFAWGPKGEWVFYTSVREEEPYYDAVGHNSIYGVRVEARGGVHDAKLLETGFTADLKMEASGISMSPDGKQIAFHAAEQTEAPARPLSHGQEDLFVLDVAWDRGEPRASGAPRNLTEKLSYEMGSGVGGDNTAPRGGGRSAIAWSADGARLMDVAAKEGSALLLSVDARTGEVKELTASHQAVVGFTGTEDGKKTVALISNPLLIGDLFEVNGEQRQTQLTHVNDELFSKLDLDMPKDVAGVVVAGLSSPRHHANLDDLGISWLIAVVVSFTISLELVVLTVRVLGSSMRDLRRATEKVRSGDFSARVPVVSADETGGLARSFNMMVEGLEERERLRNAFGAYVDPDVAERVLKEGADLSGEEREVSILFLDIRDFTAIAERSDPREVVSLLNDLWALVVPILLRHDGHANKFIGDGLLAVFGAPDPHEDHATGAVGAALELAAAVREHYGDDLAVGIGVNTGPVVAGTVGGGGRVEFTVIGDAVNVAARVEAATRETGDDILITEATKLQLADDGFELDSRPGVELKGKAEGVSLWAVHPPARATAQSRHEQRVRPPGLRRHLGDRLSTDPAVARARPRAHAPLNAVRRFWRVAWDANITGQSAMLAYNMLLAVVPIALIALFIAGQVLSSARSRTASPMTCARCSPGRPRHAGFPARPDPQLDHQYRSARRSWPAIWLSSSFWGALDTAFARIYGCPSRRWLEQKRFALSMLIVVLVFMVATVIVPTAQSILRAGVKALPFDLAHVAVVVYAASLALGVGLVFLCLAVIYLRVPNRRVPWRAVWPGALGATLAIVIVDYGFPLYLSRISTIARFGTTIVFVLILLGWFYVLAIIILSGGIINALRLQR